ncbi:hypothetical protein WI42_09655 [Burkholderia ubonensis]|nr:hypothetical protein WI42_09655 [Burkholderia ubonensis]
MAVRSGKPRAHHDAADAAHGACAIGARVSRARMGRAGRNACAGIVGARSADARTVIPAAHGGPIAPSAEPSAQHG